NGIIFNQKYNAETLKGEDANKKMMDYITTYQTLGGAHIQLNVIDSDTLRDAKEHPEKHKGLVVRVAGYSAFFNELAEEIQDSIIERTEHQI
ncbi:MAG: glycine radical domain-containing protein, partial [Christensenella sp.]|uniref:glycine radical domain-containing protein n=1 Tax=Christensenella sp. TaxID=1935934 RepID=UPI002B211239